MELQDIIQKRNLHGIGVNLKNILSKQEIEFLKQEIIKLNQTGMSFTQISKKLNIGRHVIRKWMKAVDYEIINTQNRLRIKNNLFQKITTEEDAYWLGFLYADGYISDKGMVEVCLKSSDYTHLLKFADYCGFDRNKVVKKQKTNFPNSFRCRLSFSTQHLKDNFIKHGVVPRKSEILTFPKWLDKSLYSHFIRGYFDGDGHLHIVKLKTLNDYNRVSVIGTKEFLTEILTMLNIKQSLCKDVRHSGNTFSIEFRKENGLKFLEFIYKNANVYLERKYNLYIQ